MCNDLFPSAPKLNTFQEYIRARAIEVADSKNSHAQHIDNYPRAVPFAELQTMLPAHFVDDIKAEFQGRLVIWFRTFTEPREVPLSDLWHGINTERRYTIQTFIQKIG